MTPDQVLDILRRFPSRLVEITGGEPLLQEEVFSLISELLDRGYQVLIETGGSLDIRRIDHRAHIIMDLKCPGSEMSGRMMWQNLQFLRRKDEVKFVIRDRADFEWACTVTRRHDLNRRCTVLFAPVYGEMEPRLLAEWILQQDLAVQLQLQLHKYIWNPEMRGV